MISWYRVWLASVPGLSLRWGGWERRVSVSEAGRKPRLVDGLQLYRDGEARVSKRRRGRVAEVLVMATMAGGLTRGQKLSLAVCWPFRHQAYEPARQGAADGIEENQSGPAFWHSLTFCTSG